MKCLKLIFTLLLCSVLLLCLCACDSVDRPNAQNPVTLTMWHVYGSQTQSPLNDAIDRFNSTIGIEQGITINVVSVTSSSAIDKALSASSRGEPGAEEMPDLFTAYPRVAEIVGKDRLLPWNAYFSSDELAAFRKDFLSEGYFGEALLMLPIAKSMEALYYNETLLEPFCKETGIDPESLSTFSGVFQAAQRYYDYSQGQNFFQINDYYHYAYLAMKAQGSEFVVDGKLQLETPAFRQIWEPLAQAAIYGGICLEDGYAAARWKTIEILSNTGSTADILYQPDSVVYPDNSTQAITTAALPYPHFDSGDPAVVFRGGGLFAVRSENEQKNYAAYVFAKWLTEEENSLPFVTTAGYLPVTDAALERLLSNIDSLEDPVQHRLYEAVRTMLREYQLYALPLYEGASGIQFDFENHIKFVLKAAHNDYLRRVEQGESGTAVLEELVDSSLRDLQALCGQ